LLTILPSAEEIKKAVFAMCKDSAPGPDGFGAFFYKTYWEIINVWMYVMLCKNFSTTID
jgi:hypothetical protein